MLFEEPIFDSEIRKFIVSFLFRDFKEFLNYSAFQKEVEKATRLWTRNLGNAVTLGSKHINQRFISKKG